MKCLIYAVACAGILSCAQNGNSGIEINSSVLRNRVIVLDRVVLKKALYVAFTMPVSSQDVKVKGTLVCDGQRLAEAALYHFSEKTGNLVFDLPVEIPEGRYEVLIEAAREQGGIVARGSLTMARKELRSTIGDRRVSASLDARRRPKKRYQEALPTEEEKSTGYIIFTSSPLDQYDESHIPARSEVCESLRVRVVRNEYEPITFSLYPLRALGRVHVKVSMLEGKHGTLPHDSMEVGHVESFKYPWAKAEAIDSYPHIIRTGEPANVEAGLCVKLWLTLHIGAAAVPGEYRGIITVTPERGRERQIPLIITVEPVLLEDIPGKDYFMLMTYEFTEMTMPWTALGKKKIYEAACNILKDYRAHGMTTVCIHSPFVLMRREDGSPDLEDIYATLRAARDIGFTRPVIWYMGHLIQTAKPRHPGNITAFDDAIDVPRLKALVENVTAYARKHGCPEVIIFPIDEPDDQTQDPKSVRREVTPRLLQTIKDSGARTMITSRTTEGLGSVDFLDSCEFSDREIESAHRNGRAYRLYNNNVTTECDNPAYARYIYGYYVWATGVDGMSSWTFQNTQNASGRPDDVFLAYPDPMRPIPTPKWEAIREGIDDYKLIYQLIKRIDKLRKAGLPETRYEEFLSEIKRTGNEPSCNGSETQGWNDLKYQRQKDNLISLIINADKQLAAGTSKHVSKQQRVLN